MSGIRCILAASVLALAPAGELSPTATLVGDRPGFGHRVVLARGQLLVGRAGSSTHSGTSAFDAFARQGDSWDPIIVARPEQGPRRSLRLATDGRTTVVGGPTSAWVHELGPEGWSPVQRVRFAPTSERGGPGLPMLAWGEQSGGPPLRCLDVHGDWLALGGVRRDENGREVGEVQLHRRTRAGEWERSTAWRQDYPRVPGNVALDATTLAVALGGSTAWDWRFDGVFAASVELFRVGDPMPVHRLELPAETDLGAGLALERGAVLVGAPRHVRVEDTGSTRRTYPNQPGAVLRLERQGSAWIRSTTLWNPMPQWSGPLPFFGGQLSASGERVAVARRDPDRGRVYVFRRAANGAWREEARTPAMHGGFGTAVALNGDWLAVGQPSFEPSRGRVLLFHLP